MRSLLFCFICILSLNLCSAYEVDLSSSSENRWTKLIHHYDQKSLRNYAQMLDQSMAEESYILGFTWVRKLIMSYGWDALMEIDPEWFKDLRDEIKGLSNALKERMDGESLRGFREEDLFLLNIGYDFSTYCTSGVYNTSTGPILFRNLDWDGDDFKKFTFETEFRKDNEQIFRSIQFLGQVGILTAMKPDAYAVALNFRKSPGTGADTFELGNIKNFFQFFFKNGWPASILLRYTMEHETDYANARHCLENEQLIAPCYLILAGVEADEGVIIERARDSKHTRDFSDPFENPNFLVQTNHDVPLPSDQDANWASDDPLLNDSMGMGTVTRRNTAIDFLSVVDPSILNGELMHMLTSCWPIANNVTIFSSLLNPKENTLEWVTHP